MAFEAKEWCEGMGDAEAKELAYWERNMLALAVADGWYNDDVEDQFVSGELAGGTLLVPRYEGWRRVLSCWGGKATFHVPDDFPVGTLPEIDRNWDGHSTREKWERIARARAILP